MEKLALRLELIVQRSNQYGCEIKAMECENRRRELEGAALAYDEANFMEYAAKFDSLAQQVQDLLLLGEPTGRAYQPFKENL